MSGPTASAHEFWIDPVQYTPKVGASVPIVFRIGIKFSGDTYPYVRALSERFSVFDGRGERQIKTLDGDDPAAEVKFSAEGLAIVATLRKPEEVVFPTFEKFQENLSIEGLEPIIEAHRNRRLPMSDIRELYARCAKALLSVGRLGGKDRVVGLPLELVAEKNPYELSAIEPLPIRLLYKGKPIMGVLVKSFNRDDPSSPRLTRSDAEGRIFVDVSRRGEYLVSAVHMLEPAPGVSADWVSFWASLTFARP